MRAVLQRVSEARVTVNDETVGLIGTGWLCLVGVTSEDTDKDVLVIADKILNLRGFHDQDEKMNLSVTDIQGSVLVVSQFTLYGDCRKGRRPSFGKAAPPDLAESLYQKLVGELQKSGLKIETGRFQADMKVGLVNCGPVTFILDSNKQF